MRRFCGVWAGELDLATLDRVTTVLQSSWLQERRPDHVWRAKRRDGQGDVYIAFEFQSRADPRMPFRVLEYQALLLGELIRARADPEDRLAAVVSVVVYNGRRVWEVAADVVSALGVAGTVWESLVPNACYESIDMLRSPLGEVGAGDFATVMARLERAGSWQEFVAGLEHAVQVLKGRRLRGSELERALVRWVCDELVAPWSTAEKAAMLREVRDLDEALSAIQLQIKEWASEAQRAHARGLAKGRRLGHEEGRREGLREGRREGLASSLLIVLRARFGRVGGDLERRIRDAQPQQLQRWLRRAAKAESLEAVFEGE